MIKAVDIAAELAGRPVLLTRTKDTNIGKTLGIGGVDHVQDMIRLCRLEEAAHPPPALDRVAEEVEHDGHALAEQLDGLSDHPPSAALDGSTTSLPWR